MDTGLPRLEFEAHGRIASAVAKTRENRASYDKNQRISAFQAPFYRPGRFKTDRLLEARCRRASTLLGWPAPYAETQKEFATGLPAELSTQAPFIHTAIAEGRS